MKQKIITTAMVFAIICSVYNFDTFAASKTGAVEVRRIEVNIPTIIVRVNQQRLIYEIITPSDADDKSVDWSTSDKDIATVDQDGVITGVSPGTAVITVTASNGRSAKCTVTVPGIALAGIETDVTASDDLSAVLNSGELVSVATVKLQVQEALDAVKKGKTATVTFCDKTQISAAALRAAAFTASYENKSVKLQFDTKSDGAAIGRLTVDPVLAKDLTGDIRLKITTNTKNSESVQKKFEKKWGGTVAVIQCGQQGTFGMDVNIAAKLDLTGLDLKNLRFYSYDKDGNTVTLIQNPGDYIDANGFLHFTTSLGGYIIITAQVSDAK